MIFNPDESTTAPPGPTLCLATALLAGAGAAHAEPAGGCARLCDLAWMARASVTEVETELDATPGAATRANEHGITPLHRAAMANPDPRVAARLIAAGADLEARDAHGATPLHFAAGGVGEGNLLLITGLAAKYLHTPSLRRVQQERRTFEHTFHAGGNHPSVVEHLLDAGADATQRDAQGDTPLHYAAFNTRHTQVVERLLAHGAEADAINRHGLSPLHYTALGNDHPKIAEVLLNHGANLERRTHHTESTPLHSAALGIAPDTLALLLERGADIAARDHREATPLHYAAKNPVPDLAQALIEHGAPLELTDDQGRTPLLAALDWANPTVALLLVRNGADPQAEDHEGRSAVEHLEANQEFLQYWSPRDHAELIRLVR